MAIRSMELTNLRGMQICWSASYMPSKRIDGARLESIASPLHRACRGRLLKMNPSTRLRRRNPNDVNMSRWLGRLMCQLLRAEGDLSSETKRARHSWPEPFQRQAQIGMLSGQDLELGDLTSLVSSMAPSGFTCSSSSLYAIGVAQIVSPQRVDDKDGHYVLAVGENLTARYKINRKMGEGTFGQVLECWDCEKKEIVAVNIVCAVDKYREAAMIEIDVLLQLKKQKMTLSVMHDLHLIHTDLKPENILFVSPEYTIVSDYKDGRRSSG